MRITEGALEFTFRDGWECSKVDDWSFYKRQFERYFDGVRLTCKKCDAKIKCSECGEAKTIGVKAIDLLAIDPESVVWLIEIKDYRRHRRIKAIDLADEVAVKVCDSLAMFVAASKNANDPIEKNAASAVCNSSTIRVVLHLEQVQKPSRLFPRAINPANIKQRLRRLIHFVDPHPTVVETNSMRNVPWAAALTAEE